jgi:excisionase family DNA binding protein
MPTTKKRIDNDWISLTEAADILGVHPSTVRNWSDSGALPVYRTTGRHRRYKRSEVELWSQSKRQENQMAPVELMKAAVRQIRIHVAEGSLEEEAWYQKLDEEARTQYRLSGGVLARGLMNYLSEENDGVSDEARSLGYEYASRAQRHQLNSAEATRAFLFFRNMLIEAVMRQLADSNISSKDAWHLLSRVIAFTDQIQLSLLETFDSYLEVRHGKSSYQ